jgi:serine/threonine protein kinase
MEMRSGSLLNSRIGEYQLVDFLGAGGMGEVYRAVHTKIGKVVAIKVLSTSKSANGGMGDRFINEARIQARLHHPGIASLYDYTEVGGCPCIIMECVNGRCLDELIKANGPFQPAQALKIFEAIAEAINYIHSNSIVHRDIKSNNVKIDEAGEVKLLDFGIAKSSSSPKLTAVGDVIGTFTYMAPELLKGGVADARSDIWSLGVLLYEMVSGDMPFRAETLGELFEQIRRGAYIRPASFDPLFPQWVETIVSKCLKTQPVQRYQSVQELLQDIRRFRVDTIDEPEPPPGYHDTFRNYLLPVGALGALALVLTAIVYFLASGPAPTPSRVPDQPVAPLSAKPVSTASELRSVRISVLEGSAQVFQNDRQVGVTPYELNEPLGKHVDLVLKRTGFKDKKIEFSVTDNKKEYTIALDPDSH